MNFTDTFKSVELVLAAHQVPLLVGETGIGKTALAKDIAQKHDWALVAIDGNLLKEGEIGGLPTIDTYMKPQPDGTMEEVKTTVYAIHTKLREIDANLAKGRDVLLFIDEINRCEHAVQQELMNLILNHEINGYVLSPKVNIVAAMNPSNTFDYQAVDMDNAQQNRFVWLFMEPDYLQWLDWAETAGIEPKIMEFISTFPEYLNQANEDDVNATPRSYERISGLYHMYKDHTDTISPDVFFNVIRGNVGKVIAEEFVHFIQRHDNPLISYHDVFESPDFPGDLPDRVQNETHTRLYLAAKNMMRVVDKKLASNAIDGAAVMDRLVPFLLLYPSDLMIGVMKDIRNNTEALYPLAIDDDRFIDAYFQSYRMMR